MNTTPVSAGQTPVARTRSGRLGTTRGQRVPTLLCPAVRKLSGSLKTIWHNSPPLNSPSKRRNGRVGTYCPRVLQSEGSLKTHKHTPPLAGIPIFRLPYSAVSSCLIRLFLRRTSATQMANHVGSSVQNTR